jgi:murein DD-endopeptidase MepM/ murein hydrolase activator NlpD
MDLADTRSGLRRLAFEAGVTAILAMVALTLAAVASSVSSGSDAYVSSAGGTSEGAVAVTPPDGSAGPVTSSLSGAALSYQTGQANASSGLSEGVLVSQAAVSVENVSLLDGLVQAAGVHLVAQAKASGDGVAASTAGSTVSDLTVKGEAVGGDQSVVTIDDVGTLQVLSATSDGAGASASADVIGLRLTLSTATAGLPAGTVIVVGHAAARADQDTWRALVPSPSPSPSPSSSTTREPTPHPMSTATVAKTLPKATGEATSSGALASPVASFDPAPMPAPVIAADAATRFPGAVFPVLGIYTYSHDWLAPRVGHLHQGIDIFAARGTPLVAVQDGTVDALSNYGLGGISLHVTNERGDYFYYAHLSGYAPGVHEGMAVKAGEVIGYVGNTGDAATTPPHLHFEVHPGGGPAVDPFPYLEAWRAQDLLTAQVTQHEQMEASGPVGPDYWKLRARGLAQEQDEPVLVPLLTPLHPEPDGNGGSDTDPVSGLPLVVISAVGAAVLKRLQWAALLP